MNNGMDMKIKQLIVDFMNAIADGAAHLNCTFVLDHTNHYSKDLPINPCKNRLSIYFTSAMEGVLMAATSESGQGEIQPGSDIHWDGNILIEGIEKINTTYRYNHAVFTPGEALFDPDLDDPNTTQLALIETYKEESTAFKISTNLWFSVLRHDEES